MATAVSKLRQATCEEHQKSRPQLPTLLAQPLVTLYNTPRSAEVAVRKSLRYLRDLQPNAAVLVHKQIQHIEVLTSGGRIYLNDKHEGVVELPSILETHSLAWIAATLAYAARRIAAARRGATATPPYQRVQDLQFAIMVLKALAGSTEEIAEQERTVQMLLEEQELTETER